MVDWQASETARWIVSMGYAQILAMVSRKDDCSASAVGYRLRLLREVLGYKGRGNQKKFAAMVGIGANSWNSYEQGNSRISVINMRKLKRKTGVTSDWVYFGDTDDLPLNIARRLLPPEELAESA
jgi:transcriptional regulator with XRE-family HTH domain